MWGDQHGTNTAIPKRKGVASSLSKQKRHHLGGIPSIRVEETNGSSQDTCMYNHDKGQKLCHNAR